MILKERVKGVVVSGLDWGKKWKGGNDVFILKFFLKIYL